MAQWFFGLGPFRRREEWIQITVETDESWGVRAFRRSERKYCPKCGTDMGFPPAAAGSEVSKTERPLLGWPADDGLSRSEKTLHDVPLTNKKKLEHSRTESQNADGGHQIKETSK